MKKLPFGQCLRFGAGNNAVEADNDNDMKNSTPFYNGAENVGSCEIRIRQRTRRPKQPQVGHLVTSSDLKPDPDKVETIQKLPRDQKISSECDEFVDSLPLCQICVPIVGQLGPTATTDAHGADWRWTKARDGAFQQLVISIAPSKVPEPFGGRGKGQNALRTRMRFYDSTKQLTHQCDANDRGFGTALLQGGGPRSQAAH